MSRNDKEIIEKAQMLHSRDLLLGIDINCIQRTPKYIKNLGREYIATYNKPYFTIIDVTTPNVIMHQDIGDITHGGLIQLTDTSIVVDLHTLDNDYYIACITSTTKSLIDPSKINGKINRDGHINRSNTLIKEGTSYRQLWFKKDMIGAPSDYADRIFLLKGDNCRETIQFWISKNYKSVLLDFVVQPGKILERRILNLAEGTYYNTPGKWEAAPEFILPTINKCGHGIFIWPDINKHSQRILKRLLVDDASIILLLEDGRLGYSGIAKVTLTRLATSEGLAYPAMFNRYSAYECVIPDMAQKLWEEERLAGQETDWTDSGTDK